MNNLEKELTNKLINIDKYDMEVGFTFKDQELLATDVMLTIERTEFTEDNEKVFLFTEPSGMIVIEPKEIISILKDDDIYIIRFNHFTITLRFIQTI